MTGKTRLKICLCAEQLEGETPADTAQRYAADGYDAVAVAKRWEFEDECEGVLSSCEYKIGNPESTDGEFTLVGVGMTSEPDIPTDWEGMKKTSSGKCAEAIRLIHRCNGFAFLRGCVRHKNTPEQISRLEGLDGIEVFSPVFDECESSYLCDVAAASDIPAALLSAGENGEGGIFVEAREAEPQSIVRALRAGRFYASETDSEVHISQLPSGRVQVSCSPAMRIEFFTDSQTEGSRRFVGQDLVFAEYVPQDNERYVRAEITDMNGRRAWTNPIKV